MSFAHLKVVLLQEGKIISIFLLLITMICSLCVTNTQSAKAAFAPIEAATHVLYEVDNNNMVYMSNKGEITIRYDKGYTELMILAYACADGEDADKSNDDDDLCDSFKKNPKIIHLSGDYYRNYGNNSDSDEDNKNKYYNEKSIHLFNYFEYDEIVKINIITTFMTDSWSGSYTGQYAPLFCTPNTVGCSTPGVGETVNSITARVRVAKYACKSEFEDKGVALTQISNIAEKCIIDNDIEFVDKKKLVLAGPNYSFSVGANSKDDPTAKRGEFLINVGNKNGDFVKVGNSQFQKSMDETEEMINDTVIPTAVLILLIAAAISIAVLGYKIVKSADEPEVRSTSIKTLKSILIGIAIALLLLFVLGPAREFIQKYLEE